MVSAKSANASCSVKLQGIGMIQRFGMRTRLCSADLSFITKLGQDSHMLSVRVVLLVDGELAARLQLFLGMNNANVIDDGNLLLGVPHDEGPDPVKAMA